MATTVFTRNWIGGDIRGIAALASRLQWYPGQIKGIIEPIGQRVDGLVHDAGWWGDAASGFRQTWEMEARAAVALAEVLGTTGSLLQGFSEVLGEIEGALERAADEAHAAGVPVGTDGRPVELPPVAPQSLQQAASTYAQAWQDATDMAARARYDANARLQELLDIIGPPEDGGNRNPRPDEVVLVGDYLRGFWGLFGSGRRLLGERLASAREAKAEAQRAFKQARKTRSFTDAIKSERRATDLAAREASTRLTNWEKATNKVPLAKLLDVRLSDLGKFGELVRGMTGESEWLKSLVDIPVVDMLAAAAVTLLTANNDIQEGQAGWQAYSEEFSANLAGLSVGALAAYGTSTLVAGGIGLVAGAGAAVSAPALLVVAPAAVIGGVVAIGVGDFVSEAWHEHLDEDFHEYGIVGGLGHAVANTAGRTVNDMAGLVQSTGHAITGFWNSIFGG